MISSLVGFILYFLLTVYSIKKVKPKTKDFIILLALVFGLFILEIPIRISSWENTLVSLPDFILHFFGIIAGYIFTKTKIFIGIGVAITGLAVAIFMFFSGYNLWLNRISYGTFTGTVIEKAPEFNISSDKYCLTNESIKNKLIVLDFWHTACGVCFKKFPVLQRKYDKYKNIQGIEFYAVNIHIKRDTLNQAVNTLKILHYTFPVIVIDDDTLLKKFKVSGVPIAIIIKNGVSIVYRGDIDGIDNEIEKFKNGH